MRTSKKIIRIYETSNSGLTKSSNGRVGEETHWRPTLFPFLQLGRQGETIYRIETKPIGQYFGAPARAAKRRRPI